MNPNPVQEKANLSVRYCDLPDAHPAMVPHWEYMDWPITPSEKRRYRKRQSTNPGGFRRGNVGVKEGEPCARVAGSRKPIRSGASASPATKKSAAGTSG